jgi:hypothetical protein
VNVFDEVRIAKPSSPGGYSWDKSKVHTDLHRLMIRFNDNGHVLLAERPEDEYSDDPYFQWSGWVVGRVDVDEYGITFDAVVDRHKGNLRHVVVTKKGVYGS